MFCINKFLFENLSYYKKIKNYHFYFSDDCKNRDELSKLVTDPSYPAFKVFSTRRRRKVWVADIASREQVICKQTFLARHKRKIFKEKAAVIKEIKNHYRFSSCPYKFPEIYGYYEKRVLSIPVECGIFMSFLSGFDPIAGNDFGETPQLIVDLYRNGLFHGDLHTKNILVNKESGEMALCDLDVIEIVPRESLPHLLRMAGGFLYSTQRLFPDAVDQDYKSRFISSLYDKLPVKDILKFADLKKSVLELSEINPWKVTTVK